MAPVNPNKDPFYSPETTRYCIGAVIAFAIVFLVYRTYLAFLSPTVNAWRAEQRERRETVRQADIEAARHIANLDGPIHEAADWALKMHRKAACGMVCKIERQKVKAAAIAKEYDAEAEAKIVYSWSLEGISLLMVSPPRTPPSPPAERSPFQILWSIGPLDKSSTMVEQHTAEETSASSSTSSSPDSEETVIAEASVDIKKSEQPAPISNVAESHPLVEARSDLLSPQWSPQLVTNPVVVPLPESPPRQAPVASVTKLAVPQLSVSPGEWIHSPRQPRATPTSSKSKRRSFPPPQSLDLPETIFETRELFVKQTLAQVKHVAPTPPKSTWPGGRRVLGDATNRTSVFSIGSCHSLMDDEVSVRRLYWTPSFLFPTPRTVSSLSGVLHTRRKVPPVFK